MFASLFDETTAESSSATQALNPGFFFKEAADYGKKRKISAFDVCQVSLFALKYKICIHMYLYIGWPAIFLMIINHFVDYHF